MTRRSEHPVNLPWYVSGAIDPAEADEVRAHVALCAECAEQVDRLASIRGTILRHRGTLHIPATLLAAFARDGLAGALDRREEVRRHLSLCAQCREDLSAMSPVTPAAAPSAPRRWRIAAALAAVLLGGAILFGLLREPPETITFLPSQRGQPEILTLSGAGPWSFKIVFPYEAPEGTYGLRIEREDGAVVEDVPGRITRGEDGAATARIRALRGPGSYRMILTPPVPAVGSPYEYVFRVAEKMEDSQR